MEDQILCFMEETYSKVMQRMEFGDTVVPTIHGKGILYTFEVVTRGVLRVEFGARS
jgi:hypothetical protein